MKKENVLVLCLIVVILISWSNFNSSRNLQQSMRQMQSEMSSLRSQLTHEVNRVFGVVQQTQEESRWWSQGGTEILEVGKDEAKVKIDWFLREYQEGSAVTFNYRKPGENNFTPIDAEKGTDGYFYTILPIEMVKEPIWENYVTRLSSSSFSRSNTSETVVEEKHVSLYQQMRYEYYISVTKDDTTRIGETYSIDLSKLSYSLFNPLNSHVDISQDGPVYVNVIERKIADTYYSIENVHLESRKGNRLVEKWLLEEIEDSTYRVMAEREKDFDSLYIVIKYNEGVLVEKEIK